MSALAMFGDWIVTAEFWLIVGLVVLLLEMLDGSLVVFLPIGTGMLLNALLIHLAERGVTWLAVPTSNWQALLIMLAISSFLLSLLIRFVFRRKRAANASDVNEY